MNCGVTRHSLEIQGCSPEGLENLGDLKSDREQSSKIKVSSVEG